MKRLAAVAAAAAMALLCACRSAGTSHEWVTHHSTAGGYTVKLPGPLEITDRADYWAGGGMFAGQGVKGARHPKLLLAEAGHVDIPEGRGTPTSLANEIMESLLVKRRGHLEASQGMRIDGYPAAEATIYIDTPPAVCTVRVVTVVRRIVYAYGCARERDANEPYRVVSSLLIDG